ncbi:MAG: hypothetical protein HON98_13020 [Chloroflexi bacterium]|jgi:hypothetical protein|nr:hypothetical protein [Chloroflexota bacterium]MBT4003348.1 hypothetical protein [Chloroflexota bacterium]MBT4305880.1 hypothetical protein [Chloroflexota bacterium]MBT4533705.1 hypothetical protein [Chloroflexota bacterium]MBT4681652.1 hypothetical protein [Chloroflexota bacterium]
MENILEFFYPNQLINVLLIIINFVLLWVIYFRKYYGTIKLICFFINLAVLASALVYPPSSYLILGLMLILLFPFRNNNPKILYQTPKAVFEGGGIRRGLTPPETAGLLGKTPALVITLVIMQMLKKGFLEFGKKPLSFLIPRSMQPKETSLNYVDREKSRRENAQKLNAVLTPYEEMVFEYFEQKKGLSLNEMNFDFFPTLFSDYLNWRIGGYDIPLSKDYYEKIVNRSHIEIRSEGNLINNKSEVIERNIFWILLSTDFEQTINKEFSDFFPSWFETDSKNKERRDFIKEYKDLVLNVQASLSDDLGIIEISENINATSENLLSDIAKATRSG